MEQQKNHDSLIRRVTYGAWTQSQGRKLPAFRADDTIGVYVRVREGEKERVQLYKGIVIKIQGVGMSRSFTVRKISGGVGVERTFPFASPAIDRIEVVSLGHVRRGKLLYLRQLQGKAAAIQADLFSADSSTTEQS